MLKPASKNLYICLKTKKIDQKPLINNTALKVDKTIANLDTKI